MTLHPHQHRALVEWLRQPAYQPLRADEAFARATTDLKRLGTYRFLTQDQYDAIPPKRKPSLYVIVTKEEQDAFLSQGLREQLARDASLAAPNNMPGFPNKLRRDWFDTAWAEAGGKK